MAGGIIMAIISLCEIVQERNNTAVDVLVVLGLFVLGLPGLSVVLASLFIEVDQQEVAKVIRLGRIWRWRYSAVRWDEISVVKVYQTSRREFLNVEIKTADGRLMHFCLPINSGGAQHFQKLAGGRKV